MLIVVGRLRAKPGCVDELRVASLAHVERSRGPRDTSSGTRIGRVRRASPAPRSGKRGAGYLHSIAGVSWKRVPYQIPALGRRIRVESGSGLLMPSNKLASERIRFIQIDCN